MLNMIFSRRRVWSHFGIFSIYVHKYTYIFGVLCWYCLCLYEMCFYRFAAKQCVLCAVCCHIHIYTSLLFSFSLSICLVCYAVCGICGRILRYTIRPKCILWCVLMWHTNRTYCRIHRPHAYIYGISANLYM